MKPKEGEVTSRPWHWPIDYQVCMYVCMYVCSVCVCVCVCVRVQWIAFSNSDVYICACSAHITFIVTNCNQDH